MVILLWAVGLGALGLAAWKLYRHWRMYDDPKWAVRQARKQSERLRKRPLSDGYDEDAAGPSW